ncbi:MAG: TM2 domain-containing protein [Bacilli bacterium]
MDTISENKDVITEKKDTKFCKHCGETILKEAVLCTKCGLQVEELKQEEKIVINNNNTNTNANINTNMINPTGLKEKNKWLAFALCFFIGYFGAHKFYEGKTGMGVLYLFTGGLLGIGWLVDTIAILFKPNPYYV